MSSECVVQFQRSVSVECETDQHIYQALSHLDQDELTSAVIEWSDGHVQPGIEWLRQARDLYGE